MDYNEEQRTYKQRPLYTEEQRQASFDLGVAVGSVFTFIALGIIFIFYKLFF